MFDGKIVFERYNQSWTADTIHRLASGTKSFSAAILAAAVKDSLLTLDEPVSKTLNEWQTDPRLSKITLRQLLSLSSGIDPGDNGKVPSYSEAIAAKVLQPAGEKFAYGPAPFQIFGEVMRRKLEARNDLDFSDSLAYLRNRVLDPIGLEVPVWCRDTEGMPHLPSGAAVSAREWVKYGEFLRQEGTWEGKGLVDPETLKVCRTPSQANPAYGLTFWLLGSRGGKTDGAPGLENSEENSAGFGDIHVGAYMAAGAGKQRLYIIPSRKVVVVHQAESKGVGFDDGELLGHLFGE